MKKLFVLAACGALAACGGNDVEEADTQAGTDVAMNEPVTAPGTTDGTVTSGQLAGTYEMTADDGTVTMQELNADGTYVDMVDGRETDRGTYRQQGSQLCYTSQAAGSTEECFTGGTPGADGSFEMTDSTGAMTSTVRRVES